MRCRRSLNLLKIQLMKPLCQYASLLIVLNAAGISISPAHAQPASRIAPQTLSVMVNTNSALVNPTNFFAVNSNLMNGSVNGGSLATNALLKGNNLGDVGNPATARGNLGLGSLSTISSPLAVANGGGGATTLSGLTGARSVFGGLLTSTNGASLDPSTLLVATTYGAGLPNGDYLNQLIVTKYGQIFVWNGNDWRTIPQFPYGVQIYAGLNETQLWASNNNAVAAIRNFDSSSYPGFRFLDNLGQEHCAFTWCNSNSTYALSIGRPFCLIEAYDLTTDPIYFGAGTKAIGGVEQNTGDLVWFSGSSGAGATNFRVVRSSGEIRSEANVLRVGSGATSGAGHAVIIGGYLNPSGFDPLAVATMDISGTTVKLLKLIPANYTTASIPLLDVGNNGTGLFFPNADPHLHFADATTDVGKFSGTDFYSFGSVTAGASSKAASAVLQADSTSKGFLPPRMTKAQRNAISSPATGLVVYQTDNTSGLRAYNGTHWVRYTETNDD
jgi:hypothetical protein